jgi:hypothetical protein
LSLDAEQDYFLAVLELLVPAARATGSLPPMPDAVVPSTTLAEMRERRDRGTQPVAARCYITNFLLRHLSPGTIHGAEQAIRSLISWSTGVEISDVRVDLGTVRTGVECSVLLAPSAISEELVALVQSVASEDVVHALLRVPNITKAKAQSHIPITATSWLAEVASLEPREAREAREAQAVADDSAEQDIAAGTIQRSFRQRQKSRKEAAEQQGAASKIQRKYRGKREHEQRKVAATTIQRRVRKKRGRHQRPSVAESSAKSEEWDPQGGGDFTLESLPPRATEADL